MSNLLFSQGGISASTGIRGGQISHGLTGRYESLILNNENVVSSTNKIIIIVKFMWNDIKLFQHLKNNGNKIILDFVDLTDKEIFDPNKNINMPNFLPKIPTEYFDGYIVNNTRMKKWWVENIDTDNSKPIFVIPHHWDMRFRWFPNGYYDKQPYFYFLGTDTSEGYKNQNCLHLNELQSDGYLDDWRTGNAASSESRIFLDKPVNGCQLSIRKKSSWEYITKPATKLSTSAAMDSVLITTNDWSIRDLLSEPYPDYPYLLKTSQYDEVVDMIGKVKDTFEKEEWFLAKEIMKKVRNDLTIDNIVNQYKEIDSFFNVEN